MTIWKLTRHERAALADIRRYGEASPFFWRVKSMPRLAEKGLVEPHPKDKRGYRITAAGLAMFNNPNEAAS